MRLWCSGCALDCEPSGRNCKFCKSSGCNTAKELSAAAYVDCLFCDGRMREEWCVGDISRTLSCHGSCFTGLYPRNQSDSNPVYDLARGCLDELEYDDREACAAGTLANCVSCSGANTADVPEDRLSCNVCQDAECETTVSQVCLGYRSGEQCYIQVGDRSVTAMGCATDLEDSYLLTNRRDVYLCSGNDCNTKDKLNTVGVSCNICNSTYDDGCVSTGGSSPAVYLNEDGVLERGCLMDTDDDLFDECLSSGSSNCTICSTNGCNNEIYPSDWLASLRCDSANDADCALSPNSYSGLFEGRSLCDESQAGSCRICSGANCNGVDLQSGYVGEPGKWTDLPLSCYVCEDAASCASVTEATKCKGNNKQTCSTVFNSAGQVVARECTTETDEQACLNDANCLLCSPGDIRNCNAANISDSSSVGNRFIRFLR
ncbi:major surface trophozoite antigen 11-like [Drosophila suzukii]|uniref:Major surface trophozoite antigen 11-like n=1 Tax=Drosophila suzukii TaxID=28584 RepID=A0ABM4TLM8_DROSZ